MANTITNLVPDLYASLDVVSREQVGMVAAVSRDSGAERAAVGETVRSPVAPAASLVAITPDRLPPDNGDQTIGNKTISISKSYMVPVRWNGEEQKGLNNGPGYKSVLGMQFEQAYRALCNQVENDLCALYYKASRAIGPAGTTLFDSTGGLKDIANVRKILVDNGAPMDDITLVLNTTAGAALRGLNQYAGYNTAGTDDIVRSGILLNTYGIKIRESGQIYTHTAGTADGSTTLGTTDYAVGATTLALSTGGTGTFTAGDIVTLDNSDSNLYVVNTAVADVGTGNLIFNDPGIRKAITANAVDVDLNSTSLDRNMCFSRNAIHLVTRAPAAPAEGDMAFDSMIVQDPRSGLAFEVRAYHEYRRVKYEIGLAWGYEVIKPEHFALLID
jgi:hypothetical protein